MALEGRLVVLKFLEDLQTICANIVIVRQHLGEDVFGEVSEVDG